MEQLPLDDSTWSGGLKPADYFQSLKNYKHLVLSLYRDAAVEAAERNNLWESLPAPVEDLRMVVLTEDWCGDSASTLPYIARLGEALDLPVRVFRRSRNPHLKQWYVDRGTSHIPIVSLARRNDEEQWDEVMRWVERPEAAHAKVDAWLADRPHFEDLRARKDEDKEAKKEYSNLYAHLLRDMAAWYRGGLWSEIAREFSRNVEASSRN